MSRHRLSARIRQVRKTKLHAGRACRQDLLVNLLNRKFQADKPLHRMVTDVTYVPYFENGQWHWGYLSLVQDLYDRPIVALVYSNKQDIRLAVSTLQILSFRRLVPGAILHSDRGCIYTAGIFKDLTSRIGLTHSFSRAGNCHDNATKECFNGTFKAEALYNSLLSLEKPSFKEQNDLIAHYMDFYNRERPCSVIGNLTPAEYRRRYRETNERFPTTARAEMSL